ncbi:MAG: YafY family transcriptional regulator [Hyphomicrobiales bacterium]|nr:YafY family transcriptional regulator [Hyphomicrobiales bacterium]
MRRADRLLQIIQLLRRARRPVTAADIARELEVTPRTVYRDVASLMTNGVPVRGEAGIGYVLGEGYDLPPLMFTADELEALILGARFVEVQGDTELAAAAQDAVAKIGAVVPKSLRPILLDAPLIAPDYHERTEENINTGALRRAVRDGVKLHLDYADEHGRQTARTVWPIALGYLDHKRILIAHCELRADYRHFRTDRIAGLAILDERIPARREALYNEWWKVFQAERSAYMAQHPDKPRA